MKRGSRYAALPIFYSSYRDDHMYLKSLLRFISCPLRGVGLSSLIGVGLSLLALPVSATITLGAITFNDKDHASFGEVTDTYNGLTFNGQWLYYTKSALLNGSVVRVADGDAITSKSLSGEATIKSVNGTDRFNLTGVGIAAYGNGLTKFIFTGYRNGVLKHSQDVAVVADMKNSFVAVSLSMKNVDEVRVSNNSPNEAGNFAFDDMYVEPSSVNLAPTSLSNATVASAYNQTITATGDGIAPYSYAITAGALPAGMSLNSNGVLSGTPTAGGTFNFTITATDSDTSAPLTGSQAYTLTVAAPTISVAPASLPNGTLSVAYSQAITVSGGTSPYTYALTAGTLPAGMSLSSAGVLSGTPTASGTFNFTVTATDSSSGTGPYTDARAYALTITAAPTATTGSASSISASSATLGGTISSNGASTTVTFEYGTTASYGSSATAAQSPLVSGASGSSVSAAINGLTCNTTYHFRVKGVNSVGPTNGPDATFTTSACAPTATTGAASSISATGATLGATVSSNGASTTVTFDYGTTTGYGSSATAAPSPLSAGASGSSVSAAISGLTCNTTYYFRVKGVNPAGSVTGSDGTFTTSACVPTVTSISPSFGTIAGGTSVTITGSNFTNVSAVKFGSTSVSSYTVNQTATQITATSPAGSAGTVDITVTTAIGTSATSTSDQFTYATAPGAPTSVAATAGNTSASVTFTAPASTGGVAITGYTVTSSPGNLTGTGTAGPITVNGLANGTAYTFTVTATNSVGTGSASTASTAVTPKAAQTITFDNPGAQNFGATPTLSASSNSGLTPTFTSSTTGVCTVASGGGLTFVSAGTCTINANQAGNGSYLAATQVSQSFTVNAVAPGAPVIGTATAGNTQATVTFTAPASNGGAAITGYTVTSSPGGLTGTGASSPINVTGLTNGTAYTFTVKATNSAGTGAASAASNSVTPSVVLPPTVGAVNASVAYGSNNNAITLNVTGTYTSVAVAGAASHGTATASGTSITYTPTAGYAGSDSFTYTATNAGGTSAAGTVTINVVAPAPSAAVIGTATAGDKQATVSFTLSSSTGAASASSYTVTATPGGASATGSSSPITVTGLTNGTAYTFTVVASNSGGSSVASTASNSVTPKANQTITLNNPGTQSFTATPSVSATVSSGLAVTFSSSTPSVCSVSASGSLSFQSAGTCTITASQAGSNVWNAASASQSFTVNPVPPSPPGVTSIVTASTQATVSFTPPTFTGGTPIVGYQITATPTAGASTSKLFSVLAASAGAGVVTATGTSSPITITGLTNGVTYNFAVSALNSAGSGTTTKKVDGDPATGTPLETVPVAQAVSITVAYGSSDNAITLNLGGSAATSLTVVSTPSHGTASINGTRLSYTPAAGYSGKDSFTYTASNGGGTSAVATVSITVTPQAPSAGNVTLSVLAGSNGTAVPLALGGGAADSVTLGSSPSHGTATVNGARITYTPEANYTGSDSFTYIASNTGGTSAPGTVSIQVVARPDPTKDAEVTGLLNAQATVATRFAQTQISNVQTHLESLHGRQIAKPDDEKKRTLAGRNGRIGKATPLSTDSGTSSTDASTGTSPRANTGTGAAMGTGTGSSQKNCASRDPKLCEIMSSGSGSAELAGYIVTAAKSVQDGSGWPWRSLNLNGKNDLGNGSEVWSAGTITLGRQGDSDLNFTSSGVSFGADQRINEKLVLGMSIGFGYENQKIGDASTRNNAQSYSVTGYQSYQPTPSTYLDGLLGYSHLNYDLKRHVSAIDADANADRTGSQWFASLSGGYEYRQEQTLLSPYGRFDWISTRLNRNEESGAGSYNLTYFDQTIPVTKVSVGLRGETQREIANGKAKPYFRVEYQRNLESPSTAEVAYADLLSTIYRYDLSNVDRNTLVFGLGSNFVIRKNREWLLGYQYSVGSGSAEAHTVNLQFRQAF